MALSEEFLAHIGPGRPSKLTPANADAFLKALKETGTLRAAALTVGLGESTVMAWLAEHGMRHTRGQPYHPMTQGKIERYHRSLKNQILLENYYLPGQLEARLAEFVGNLTPTDSYFGRGLTILARREKVKHTTIELRRCLHHQAVA